MALSLEATIPDRRCSVLASAATSMERVCDVSTDGKCTEACADTHERCPVWKSEGQCSRNAEYMNEHCPESCGKCPSGSGYASAEEGVRKNIPGGIVGSIDGEDPSCVDNDERCGFWASEKECESNPGYMLKNCAKSCKACSKFTEEKAFNGADRTRWEQAIKEYGDAQRIEGAQAPDTLAVIRRTVEYMRRDIMGPNPKMQLPDAVISRCRNRNALCAFWAAIGECEANPAFMVTNCAPSCQSCHLIDFDARCPPLDPSVKPSLTPGDLNKMFERIVETAPGNRTLTEKERKTLSDTKMPEYTVTVHSRPSPVPSTVISEEFDRKLPPWVVTFDNFVTEEECQHLIDLGYEHGYERSKDVGEQKFDGSYDALETKTRTSENAWCSGRKGCRNDPIATMMHERISNVTGIPPENSEDFQLLKYEVGQFYRVHHDYIIHQQKRQCGPRILTFFLYLSDVEGGGGTRFPDLGITIMPKRGRALLWPSVLDYDPLEKDGRMRHEALPVEAGTKFACNGWIHLHDYLTPNGLGCS